VSRPGLLGNEYLRGISLVAIGAGLGHLCYLLASPLLTRLYPPAGFGAYAVFTAVLSPLVLVATGGIEGAIPLARSAWRELELTRVALALLALVTLLTVLVGPLLAKFGVAWSEGPFDQVPVSALPLALLGMGVYRIASMRFIRAERHRAMAGARLALPFGLVGGQVACSSVPAAPGLIVGDMAARLCVGLGSMAACSRKAVRAPRVRLWMGLMTRYSRFMLLAMPASVINALGLHLPALLLSMAYGLQIAGWFALARLVATAPVALVGEAVGRVYQGAAARMVRSGEGDLVAFFDRHVMVLACFGAVIAVGLFSIGGDVVTFIFGEQWRATGDYLRCLAPVAFAQTVISPLAITGQVIERQGLQLVWDILRLLLAAVPLIVLPIFDVAAIDAIAWYAMAMTAAYLLLCVLYRLAVRRHRDFAQ